MQPSEAGDPLGKLVRAEDPGSRDVTRDILRQHQGVLEAPDVT